MLRNSYNVFFPTPSFLAVPSFGFDISDESLKFIELRITSSGIKVGRYGERKIPPGIIEGGSIKDPKKLETILTSIRKEEGVKSVRVSLPEEQIYVFKMKLDKEGLEHIREGIELSLEEHIPIPGPDAIFDYEILEQDSKIVRIQVVAIPKNVIASYLEVFQGASMSVQSFELEAQAIARAVIKKGDPNAYMIVDFGEKRTGISIVSKGIAMLSSTIDVGGVILIVSKGIVVFTFTLDLGGIMLTQMIQKNFNISFEEAEKMKKQFGLQRNTANKEIFSVLLNSVSILRDEVAKHFLYWHTHKDEDGKDNPPIKKIILCGGDSNLIGLSEYFAVSLKTKVEMANVWTNIQATENSIPEISFKKALSFAASLGLALGDFDHD